MWRLGGGPAQSGTCSVGFNKFGHDTFAWQAQYLLSLKGDFTCSVECKWRFICDADQSWDSFLRGKRSICWRWSVTFRGRRSISCFLGDSGSARCIFSYEMRRQDGTSQVCGAAGARWQFYLRIMFGSCSNRLYCGGSNLRSSRCNLELGRRSIWWSYRVTFSSAHCKWVVQ